MAGKVEKVRVVTVPVYVAGIFGVRDVLMMLVGMNISAVFAFVVWLHHQGVL